jgi:ATP-dependent RNA helicase RhlE
MSQFKSFKLLESIVEQVTLKGYTEATPIQEKSIPPLMEGNDLLGIAQTGTGKTAAFSLPIINMFGKNKVDIEPKCTRSLILTPTRELASQIMDNIDYYSKGLELKTKVVYGGVGRQAQVDALNSGLDILVATPGRLLDLIATCDVDFKQLEVFVLDEADSMLDMGFFSDVQSIIERLPMKRQTILFSATMPAKIEELGQNILKDPKKVEAAPESTTVDLVDHKIYNIEKSNKVFSLAEILSNSDYQSVLIFCKTKFGADILVENLLKLQVTAKSIHSKKPQTERELALQDFKDGKVRVLVATDVAARGIDVDNISLVINYNLPEDPRNYIHRIGRTARAGKTGTAISFAVENDKVLLKSIEHIIGKKIPVETNQPFHKNFKSALKKKNNKAKAKTKKKRSSYMKKLISLYLMLLSSTTVVASNETDSPKAIKLVQELEKASEEIAKFKEWGVYGSFAYLDTWLPGKLGISGSYNTDKRDYELAFQTASYSLDVVVADLGSITDQRLHLTTRSYKGDTFNIQYGLYMNTFEAKLGDDFWGGANSTVDVLKIQTIGIVWGFGNRWRFDNGLTIGADWLRIFYPLTVLDQSDSFLKNRPDSSEKDDVEDLVEAISNIPTFTIAHFEIGYRF